MPAPIAFSRQQFKSYHQHRHLLLQFILSELLLAHQEMVKVQQLLATHENCDHPFFTKLIEHITRLSGSTQGHMRLFSWIDDGILAKLKNYCAFLCQQGGHASKEQADIYRDANNAWLISLQALDAVRMIVQQLPPEAAFDIGILCLSVEKIHRAIHRFARRLTKTLLTFRHDENVVFFIVRHREQLDDLYCPSFTRKLVRKMFPRGLSEADRFLSKKYADRGFVNMAPIIQKKIEELCLQ